MNRQQYANRIFRNQVTITEMQEQEYPALHRLLHERSDAKLKRLLFLLETALNMPNQEQGESGNWFIMPYSRLAQQGAHIAKTDVTWRKTITLFVAIGLIHRKRFTTRDELIRLAASSAADDQESAYNYRRLYELTWKRASKRILMKAYAMHKRPTDREKAEYGRVTNEWIIVRIE